MSSGSDNLTQDPEGGEWRTSNCECPRDRLCASCCGLLETHCLVGRHIELDFTAAPFSQSNSSPTNFPTNSRFYPKHLRPECNTFSNYSNLHTYRDGGLGEFRSSEPNVVAADYNPRARACCRASRTMRSSRPSMRSLACVSSVRKSTVRPASRTKIHQTASASSRSYATPQVYRSHGQVSRFWHLGRILP
jgi:hypothetical protein